MTRHLLTVDLALIVATWITAAIGASFHYIRQHQAAHKSVRGFLRFMFPPEIIRHPSCRRDYLFAVIGHFTEPFTVCPMLVAVPMATFSVYGACQALFGHRVALAPDAMLTVATLLLVLLVQDFITWFTHWVEHKSKIMWEVHKVHHSVEFLNPISNRRHHPWQFVWESGLNNAAVGLVLGIISYAYRVPVMENALLGVDAYFFASMLSFYHLRHSHIPLHYGRFEKYFLSPAQHQLHHSQEVKDWDKNFGLLTSVWDRLFGTISYTVPGYRYRIGLQADVVKDYDSVWKFWTTPPVNIVKLLLLRMQMRQARRAQQRRVALEPSQGAKRQVGFRVDRVAPWLQQHRAHGGELPRPAAGRDGSERMDVAHLRRPESGGAAAAQGRDTFVMGDDGHALLEI